jgi:hypothetical protein
MSFTDGSYYTSEESTELFVKEILPGNIYDVRERIVASITTLGYEIIEDEPYIIGRREAKNWAVWHGSADILEYPMILTVRLKSLGEVSTQATFDYQIKHPMVSKADKKVVIQEAKTIAAISRIQTTENVCSVCATESSDFSRFCRNCGSALAVDISELEHLKMISEVRAGHISIVSSFGSSIGVAILIFLALILTTIGVIDTKSLFVMLSIGGILALLSAIFSAFGWNRINRSLNKSNERERGDSIKTPTILQGKKSVGELALPQPRASITEATTNLLEKGWVKNSEKEKVSVKNRRNTNDL